MNLKNLSFCVQLSFVNDHMTEFKDHWWYAVDRR